MKQTDAAYAAGFIDGEGTISIRVEQRDHGARAHVLQVQIGLTYREPLDWMAQHFSGYVRGPVNRPNPKHKSIFFWQVSAAKAGEFLETIYPYLILKRRQADVALRLRDTNTRQGLRLTAETLAKRDALKEELRALNQRGL